MLVGMRFLAALATITMACAPTPKAVGPSPIKEALVSPQSKPQTAPPDLPHPLMCHHRCYQAPRGCGHWEELTNPCGRGRPPQWISCEPACCNPARPAEARPVNLNDLVVAVEFGDATKVISALGGHHIAVHCPTKGWQISSAKQHETASCPAGRIRVGTITGNLSVIVTRRIDNPEVAKAALEIIASARGTAWASQFRGMVEKLLAADELGITTHAKSTTEIFHLRSVKIRVSPANGWQPARVYIHRPARSLLR